jgi:predicted lipoprotein with Yx(FWY)xxD motif
LRIDASIDPRGVQMRTAERTDRIPNQTAHRVTRWARQGATAGAALAALSLPLASAASAHVSMKSSPVVVRFAGRMGVGRILVSSTGATLYRDTDDGPNDPTCTGACASVWPAYVLPAGDTTPRGGKGVKGLSTVKESGGVLQLTYMKEPLYTFVDDSGHSVTGNGDGPFEVIPAPKG